MNYIGLSGYDTANGPGVRVSLFVSGCRVHCKGCFNEESWSFTAGKPFTEATEAQIMKALDSKWIAGLSLLGGDPFEPEHAETLTGLLKRIKERFPEKTIWVWTGRTYAHVKDSPLMPYIDMLVDGPYVQKLHVEKQGAWRGSTNQRFIPLVAGHVDESLAGRERSETAERTH
ncbi:anaerobic ribonucleoside-triphosphate reductase activating protein [Sutterella sp.]|uniref:anaerobic ribonucleoside-triphosphate reductase activating protein n=1 Tax=Sutterella sp. TaxID=1981025 RepID=UPI003FD82C15